MKPSFPLPFDPPPLLLFFFGTICGRKRRITNRATRHELQKKRHSNAKSAQGIEREEKRRRKKPTRSPNLRAEGDGKKGGRDKVFILQKHKTTAQNSVLFRHLVTHTETRTIRKHAGRDIHSEQFLEEQFCRVRDVDLRDTSFVVARAAFVEALLELTML